MKKHNRICFNNHMGLWMIEPTFFMQTHQAIITGLIPAMSPEQAQAYEDDLFKVDLDRLEIVAMPKTPLAEEDDNKRRPYSIARGVAILPIEGTMMKGTSKYSSTSTIRLRQMMRMAAADQKVSSILLAIDSPGGHVAGNQDLVDDIRAIDLNVKPVHAHIDDMGASAAYWAASAARSISANKTAMIGSIGTYGVVYDQSEQYKEAGVKVHVVSTGDHKGAFVPGAEVTSAQLKDLQRNMNTLNGFFLGDVEKGRKMSAADVKKVADGRVWIGQEAADLGLVDNIRSFSDTINEISDSTINRATGKRSTARASFELNKRNP